MNSLKVNKYVLAWLVPLLLLGACLRLWHWSSQILLDDEWHALNFVFNRSFLDIIMQQGMGANSIPVNIYTWFILHTTGWSETLLRLPSLVAGIFALIVIPLLVRRIWGCSVACVVAALLAVSPVVIFYSRILRPYAPAMLLATASVLLTLIWMKEGRKRDLLISAGCGALAIYYHLYTAIPVGAPLLVALVAAIKPVGQRFGLLLESRNPFGDILIAGGVMAVIDGLLVVIPNVLNPWWSHGIHGVDHANLQTAITVLSLMAGTRNFVLMAIVLGLFLFGLVLIVRWSRVIGVAIITPFILFSLVMATTTQEGAHAGIQVARYGITFIPLAFIAIAVAVVWIGDFLRTRNPIFQRKYVLASTALVAWSPLLATSPLWVTYNYPNNFTNHSAYQYRYDPIQWQQHSPERDLSPGTSMVYGSISQLYLQSPILAAAKGVIEYPMLIGDHFNLYYYYQHFHRLPVVAGFVANNMYVPISPGRDFVYGDWSIDSVMGAMPELLRKKASWATMADITDINTMRSRFKGWMIVIHRDPLSEASQKDSPGNPMTYKLQNLMHYAFGNPRFIDGQLAAWMIE